MAYSGQVLTRIRGCSNAILTIVVFLSPDSFSKPEKFCIGRPVEYALHGVFQALMHLLPTRSGPSFIPTPFNSSFLQGEFDAVVDVQPSCAADDAQRSVLD